MTNIVEFGKIENLSLSGTKVKDWKCSHSKLELDEQRRLIECKNCGQYIEPYDYMFMFAKRDVDFRTNARCLRAEVDDLNAQIEALKKEKLSLKGKINRLKSK